MTPLHLNALALRASSCQSAAAFNPSSEFFSLFDPPPFFCFCVLVSFIHGWTPPFQPVREPTPHRPLSVNRCRTYWQIPGSEGLGCSPKWTVLCAALILCFLIPASGMIPQRLSALIFNNVPPRSAECNKPRVLVRQGEREEATKSLPVQQGLTGTAVTVGQMLFFVIFFIFIRDQFAHEPTFRLCSIGLDWTWTSSIVFKVCSVDEDVCRTLKVSY